MGTRLPLQQLDIAEPCHEDWSKMTGDDARRFCGVCQKHVHNLGAMSRERANELLAQHAGGSVCVRFSPDRNGSPMTRDDLTVASRVTNTLHYGYTVRRRRTWPFATAATIVAGLVSLLPSTWLRAGIQRMGLVAPAIAPSPTPTLMGDVAVAPTTKPTTGPSTAPTTSPVELPPVMMGAVAPLPPTTAPAVVAPAEMGRVSPLSSSGPCLD
ncbi:MAG: hypothetical protein QM770_07425 [Tepidisphaeraceae bacterium]